MLNYLLTLTSVSKYKWYKSFNIFVGAFDSLSIIPFLLKTSSNSLFVILSNSFLAVLSFLRIFLTAALYKFFLVLLSIFGATKLDDIIFIPQRLKTVTIEGEVNRPGVYELKPGETLINIIDMSGGLSSTAYLDRVQIDRIVPFDERSILGMDRMFKDVDLGKLLKSKQDFE